MIAIRRAEERGRLGRGTATSYLTFSCDQFKDPEHTGFRALRAINEDVVTPTEGVSHEASESMDMLSCLLEGELDLVDDQGRRERLLPGTIARTRAAGCKFAATGRGRSRVLQFWIRPGAARGPRSERRALPARERRGTLSLIASPDGREHSIAIGQETFVYASSLQHGDRLEHALPLDRHVWVQVLHGVVEVNGHVLTQSDGAAVSGEECLSLFARSEAEVWVFEMP
ncbi:MAG: pirin family protein [Planctomycetes bacterium]|nr:pirin family protein [Planctomycetota bacterium]